MNKRIFVFETKYKIFLYFVGTYWQKLYFCS